MTPKELEKIREGYWGRVGSEQESKFRLLFTHIDTQAAQISDLMTNCNSLRNRCWKAAAQIKALKEKLIAERMKLDDHWTPMCFDDGCHCPDTKHVAECNGCEIYKRARQQLKAETPGVEWE